MKVLFILADVSESMAVDRWSRLSTAVAHMVHDMAMLLPAGGRMLVHVRYFNTTVCGADDILYIRGAHGTDCTVHVLPRRVIAVHTGAMCGVSCGDYLYTHLFARTTCGRRTSLYKCVSAVLTEARYSRWPGPHRVMVMTDGNDTSSPAGADRRCRADVTGCEHHIVLVGTGEADMVDICAKTGIQHISSIYVANKNKAAMRAAMCAVGDGMWQPGPLVFTALQRAQSNPNPGGHGGGTLFPRGHRRPIVLPPKLVRCRTTRPAARPDDDTRGVVDTTY